MLGTKVPRVMTPPSLLFVAWTHCTSFWTVQRSLIFHLKFQAISRVCERLAS
ncbi:hypothetical protein [Massilia phosphatilytica]